MNSDLGWYKEKKKIIKEKVKIIIQFWIKLFVTKTDLSSLLDNQSNIKIVKT